MSSKKNGIQHIQEIKARHRFNHSYGEMSSRLNDIESAFRQVHNNELLRYFPIALVALIESFCRKLIAELIDNGEPYLSRAEGLLEKPKIDFEILKHLYGKQITIGEFIAHNVSINQLESIDKIFTILLGKKALQELSSHFSRWDVEISGKPETPMIKDSNESYKTIREIFEIRHILAHESATNIELEKEKISCAIVMCKEFLETLSDFVEHNISPNAPLTQSAMNSKAYEVLNETLDRINALNADILKHLSKERTERLPFYNEAHDAWNHYMKLESDFKASSVLGGSMWTLIKASSANYVAIEREKYLKAILESLHDEYFL